MFENIFACLAVLSNMGKYNASSIVDMIIYPLGHFALIIFVIGQTFFRSADTTMKFPVHPESATVEFPSLISCMFFCGRRLINIAT